MSRTAAFLAGVLVAAAAIGALVLLRGPGAGPVAPTSERAAPAAAPSPTLYQCPMHPQIVRDAPGRCPICGMDLQPVIAEPVPGGAGGPPPIAGAGPVAGRAAVTLSPGRQQLIGVRTAAVGIRDLERVIRASARVAHDPKLYEAIVEYREALRTRAALAGSSSPEARAGAEGLARAALLKLRQQGLSEALLGEVSRSGSATESLLLPGREAWIYAQVFDEDAALVRPGQEIEVTLPSLPGQVLRTRVAAIDPIVDPVTRTARVRAVVANSGGALRPEAYALARIRVILGAALAVPDEAVVDTGRQRFVFVARGGGRFEPRPVVLGRSGDGWREVLEGLVPGDEIVVSANFLVDSEARFRAAAEGFADAATPALPDGAPATAGDAAR